MERGERQKNNTSTDQIYKYAPTTSLHFCFSGRPEIHVSSDRSTRKQTSALFTTINFGFAATVGFAQNRWFLSSNR